ncbi:alpha/beta fold hydrolase BchO [Jannaschia seohaensis]|uniref:Magnesium chelatase accessory protein n=1 Tax=Jannaschia seohaensis TaxID=475081 RepID=A0A2Y9BVV0_9RHOB|nr:alpha/beta fold hydrolase BchO [Jannaschia seohaensis]PWJ21694.1 magnesium chelatase accessory protein [Jannaschia seohaensis]SSA37972.1 magnesium chelatase accessory protein [Jannaschia seohaensis]
MIPQDWPNAEASRIVESRPHRWHVQQLGTGPDLLMLHGAGASTHSWAALAPRLSGRLRLTMIDLPGHGFSRAGTRARSGLDAMAEDITALLAQLEVTPAAYLGHSAGAALALRLSLDAKPQRPVIAINGAFQMFNGVAGFLFPIMAKALSLNPLTVPLFTMGSTPARTRRLLSGTGSAIDAPTLDRYHRLISDRTHVAGALAMMANWSLDGLLRDAPRMEAPVLLLAGERDRTVPAAVSRDMARRLPRAQLRVESALGHLLHEEAPDLAAGACIAFLEETGVLAREIQAPPVYSEN